MQKQYIYVYTYVCTDQNLNRNIWRLLLNTPASFSDEFLYVDYIIFCLFSQLFSICFIHCETITIFDAARYIRTKILGIFIKGLKIHDPDSIWVPLCKLEDPRWSCIWLTCSVGSRSRVDRNINKQKVTTIHDILVANLSN